MRDIILVAVVFWGLSQVFARPHYGAYLWTWISLMNPHRLTWGFAYSLPYSMVIAIVTFLALLNGKQKKEKVWSRESVIVFILLLWVGITTIFAVNQSGAIRELDRFAKTVIFFFIILAVIGDRKKLEGFIWVMAISLGFYGIKGGLFTIATAGSNRVWGPPGSFIAGNNEVALAMLMTIPLLRYLQLQATKKFIRLGLLAAMLLTAFSILGSQSRGAFVGILMIGLFFWWKSPRKIEAGILVSIVAGIILMFMPDTWWDRMRTIETYEEDASAMGRINAWWVAFRAANASITGGGANMFTPGMFQRYAPDPYKVHDVHSIYFEMLGEQGWIGLALFLLLALLTWRSCSRIVKQTKNIPTLKWAGELALMLQVSLIAYGSAGAFLGLAYFDYYYYLVAAVIITSRLVAAELANQYNSNTNKLSPALQGQRRHAPYG
jgi:probable O-glycosylation ligase (exosortase A-associated)